MNGNGLVHGSMTIFHQIWKNGLMPKGGNRPFPPTSREAAWLQLGHAPSRTTISNPCAL